MATKTSARKAEPRIVHFSAVATSGEARIKAATISDGLRDKLENLYPQLNAGGLLLLGADADNKGPDDLAGELMIYGAAVIEYVLHGEDEGQDFPSLPESLTARIVGKISNAGRYALIGSLIGVGIAQAQLAKVNPKAATAFRYINKVLTALMTTGIVPAPPSALAE